MAAKHYKKTRKPSKTASNAAEPAVHAAARLDRKVRRLHKDLSSVRETSRLLTGPLELKQVLEIVVKTIAQAIGADAAGLRLLDEETGQLNLKATFGLSDAYINKGPVTLGESTLNVRALNGEAIVVEDMRTEPHFKRYHAEIAREGLVSNLTIGLTHKDKGIGTLRIYSKKPRTFSPADISTAQTVAAQSAAAIVNARLYAEALEGERMARQLKIAADVQRRLIPRKLPDIDSLDFAGVYVPCYELGGDLYDFIELPDGALVIALGDVMGKGVPASLTMASLRSSLRAYAEQTDKLDELLRLVNLMFCRDIIQGNFATLFCARIAPDHATMTYCSCGHEPPLFIRDRKKLDLNADGMVLGVEKNSEYPPSQITLQPGDLLVFFTDGLVDAVNFKGEPFGLKRLTQAAIDSSDMTADQAARNILWLMRKFAGLNRRCDDIALVTLKKRKIHDPTNR